MIRLRWYCTSMQLQNTKPKSSWQAMNLGPRGGGLGSLLQSMVIQPWLPLDHPFMSRTRPACSLDGVVPLHSSKCVSPVTGGQAHVSLPLLFLPTPLSAVQTSERENRPSPSLRWLLSAAGSLIPVWSCWKISRHYITSERENCSRLPELVQEMSCMQNVVSDNLFVFCF